MNYSGLKKYDIANGDGVRISLFVSGCENHCPGCFNPDTWDPAYGKKFSRKTLQEILDFLSKPYAAGLSLLGGDPFMHVNQECVLDIVKTVKEAYPDKDIWVYSGFTYEQIIEDSVKLELLKHCDVLVDGKFEQELYSPKLRFRGSSNQRVIDIQATLKEGQIVLYLEKEEFLK